MLGHELRNPLSAIASAVEVLNRVEAGSELAANARAIVGAPDAPPGAHDGRPARRRPRDLGQGAADAPARSTWRRSCSACCRTLEVTGDGAAPRAGAAAAAGVGRRRRHAHRAGDQQPASPTRSSTRRAGGRIEVRGARATTAQRACCRCSDNGLGIPPTLLPRVFDLFVQGERSLDRRTGGLGIGLTLVRRLVELHGGTIEADELAARQHVHRAAAGDRGAGRRRRARERRPSCSRRSVVLVEDNEDALESLRTMLELDGHTVVTARRWRQRPAHRARVCGPTSRWSTSACPA